MKETKTISPPLSSTKKVNLFSFTVFQILSAAAGFVLSSTQIFFDSSVFTAAFVSALPGQYTLTAVFGCAVSRLSEGDVFSSVCATACVCGCAVINCAVSHFVRKKEKPAVAAATAFMCCIIAGIFIHYYKGFLLSQFLLSVLDSVISGILAYFFAVSFGTSDVLRNKVGLNKKESFSVCISACAVIVSLCSFNFYTFVPARILSVLIILTAAYFGNETGGGIAGICFGIASSVGTESSVTAGYALGGLAAGLAAGSGQTVTAAVFTVVNCLVLLIQNTETAVAPILESIISGIIFIAVKQDSLDKLRKRFVRSVILPSSDSVRNSLILRMTTAANGVSQISSCMERVTGILGRHLPGTGSITSNVKKSICEACSQKESCWGENEKTTSKEFSRILYKLTENEYLSPDVMLLPIMERCIRPAELADSFNKNYLNHIATVNTNERIGSIREIMTDQFGVISDMLTDFSNELKEDIRFLPSLSCAVSEVFRSFGIEIKGINCFEDKDGRIQISAVSERVGNRSDLLAIKEAVSKCCRREMALPCISDNSSDSLIRVSQQENLCLRIGAVQLALESSNLCGDYFVTFRDGRGKEYIVLSDGMGTGGRAAVDATISAELFSQLVRAGLSFDCAVRIVNSSLLMKGTQEALSTLDVVSFDMYTGRVQLLKAGSAATFLLHGGKAKAVELSSMPIGILRTVAPEKAEMTLSKGDIIVTVSDGVPGTEEKWIETELSNFSGGSAQGLAEHIAAQAKKHLGKRKEDDLTVIAAIVAAS